MKYIQRYAQFVIEIFSLPLLWLHGVAIICTFILVKTGMDWMYLVYVFGAVSPVLLSVADITGFLLPAILPLALFLVFRVTSKKLYRVYFEASLYAVLLGFTISTIIKVFTGRTSPPHYHHGEMQPLIDNSNAFHFGFLQEQIMGGWPSSHATIAFAFAVTFAILLPPRWYIRTALFSFALFIAVGVSFGYHWLSESVAGALLGVTIGLVVGKYYKKYKRFMLKITK